MMDRIRGRALKELEDWSKDFRPLLVEREGEEAAEAILADARQRLEAMLPTIPDPGWTAPHMRMFTLGGAIYVALHLALRERGYDAAGSWSICERATRAHFDRMSPSMRKLASDGMFGWPMKVLSRWIGKKSHKEPVGGWVYDYVEGDGTFDYGVTYRRCAIRELAVAHGAADFAPYICLADVPGSETFGWGLVRTETIAQNGTHCDFRFRRNGPTDVKVRLPTVA
jgi:hypothetical protein